MHKKPMPLFFKHYKSIEELNENYKNLTDEIIFQKIKESKTKEDHLKILQLLDFYKSDELIKNQYLKLKDDESTYALQIKIYLLKLRKLENNKLLELTEDPIELAAYFSKWSTQIIDFKSPSEEFNTFLFLNNLNEKALLNSTVFIKNMNEEGLLRFYKNSISTDLPLNETLLDCLLKDIEITLPSEVFEYFKKQNRFLMVLHKRICLKFDEKFFTILFSEKYNQHSAYHDLIKQVVIEYLNGKFIRKFYVEKLLKSINESCCFLKQEIILKLSSDKNISEFIENIIYDKHVKEFLKERNKRLFSGFENIGKSKKENEKNFILTNYAEIYKNDFDGFLITEKQLNEFLFSLKYISWRKILELEFVIWKFSSALLEFKDFLFEFGKRYFQYGFIIKKAYSLTNEELLNHKYQGSLDFENLCNKQEESIISICPSFIDNTQKTPEITQKTPEITQESPEITQKTPEITQESPEITQKTPEITQESPEITQKKRSKSSFKTPEDLNEFQNTKSNTILLLNKYKQTGNKTYLKEINKTNLNYEQLLLDLKIIFKDNSEEIKNIFEHLGNFQHVFSLKFLISNNLFSLSLLNAFKVEDLLIQMACLNFESLKIHKETFKIVFKKIEFKLIYEFLFENWESLVLEIFLEKVLENLILNSPKIEYKNKCDLCENITGQDLCETLKHFSDKTIYFHKILIAFYENESVSSLFFGLSKNELKNILRKAPKKIKYIFNDFNLTELIDLIKTEEFIDLRILLYNKLEILCKEKQFNFKIKTELHELRKDIEIYKYSNWTHYTFLEFQINNDLITEIFEKSTLNRCSLKNQFCLSLWETNSEMFLNENVFKTAGNKYYFIEILKQEFHKLSLHFMINVFFNLKNPLEIYCNGEKYIKNEFKKVFHLFLIRKKYNEKKVIEKCRDLYSSEQISKLRELFK